MSEASAFAALSDPTRRAVISLLSGGPMPAGSLASATRVSPPAMSRHLRILLRAGLVTDERGTTDARLRLFRLRPEGFASLDAWLGAVRRGWEGQLMAFKRHADEGAPQ